MVPKDEQINNKKEKIWNLEIQSSRYNIRLEGAPAKNRGKIIQEKFPEWELISLKIESAYQVLSTTNKKVRPLGIMKESQKLPEKEKQMSFIIKSKNRDTSAFSTTIQTSRKQQSNALRIMSDNFFFFLNLECNTQPNSQ